MYKCGNLHILASLKTLTMPNTNSPTELQINTFISEKKPEILNLIDQHHRVLMQANPASGKTYFFKRVVFRYIN